MEKNKKRIDIEFDSVSNTISGKVNIEEDHLDYFRDIEHIKESFQKYIDKLTLAKNILFTSNLQLFANMKAFNEIDVNWDNLLAAKVNDYINVNFNVKIFYDRDISNKRQLMQSCLKDTGRAIWLNRESQLSIPMR